MSIAITILAVVVVITGVYFSQRNSEVVVNETQDGREVLSEETENESQPTVSEETPTPTSIPNTPTNTSTPTIAATNLEGYRYPGSSIASSSSNELILNSNDNSDKITDWYKDKIKSEGMNVTSFVTTKTNDNVLNKLVGADGSKEVRVEITKDSGSSTVKISVSIE